MAKQKKKGKGKVKLFLVLLLIIAILLVIIFFGGKGFGFGGSGDGDGEAGTTVETEVNTEESQDLEEAAGEEGEPGTVVVVTIKGEQVFVGDKEFADASELKAYIEEINTDDREFKLQDENSILATYEWVVDVFEELKIQLVPVAE